MPTSRSRRPSNVPQLQRLASTIESWREGLLAYFDTGGVSNGPTEGMNLLIRKVNEPGTAFAASTTTGSGCYCTPPVREPNISSSVLCSSSQVPRMASLRTSGLPGWS